VAASSRRRSSFASTTSTRPSRGALEAGALVREEPKTYEYGERSCLVEDPFGHRWELTQTVQDGDPAEWGGEGSW